MSTPAFMNDFAAILGSRRGSAGAQAERDAAEAAARTALIEGEARRSLDGFLARIERFGVVVSGALADSLVAAYRRGQPSEDTAAEQLAVLRADRHTPAFWAAAEVLDVGDPVGWPGLTGPVLQALCNYFHEAEDSRDITLRAKVLVGRLFADMPDEEPYHHFEEHYQRLEPLSDELALLLSRSTNDEGPELGRAMLDALHLAPPATLAGPLRSWVDAFALRVEYQHASAAELRALDALVQYDNDPVAAALSELKKRLQTATVAA